MNAILSRIAEGRYATGLEVFRSLADPTPEDERLAGVCLFNLHELQQAQDLLLQARANGCEAAGIDLASVYRHMGLVDLSREALDQVDPARLTDFDRVLALRERGAQHFTAGDVLAASEVLERAWALVHVAASGWILRPAVGHALGLAYADRGLDRLAADHFTEALRTANPARAVQLHAARALCLTYLGDLDQAARDLDAASEGRDLAPLVTPYVAYVAAVAAVARGRLDAADAGFGEAAAVARAAHEPETEAYAELGRCAIATAAGQTERAGGFLERARRLSINDKARALVAMRAGARAVRARQPAAFSLLEQAQAEFGRLGLLRETAWTHLHIAAAHLAFDAPDAAMAALARATDVRHALGGGASLVIELRMLPQLDPWLAGLGDDAYATVLRDDLRRVADVAPAGLELVTLGAHELHLDGRRIRLDLRRSVEVLAYLMDNPGVPLERVLLDLFPERDSAHGRSYFHQVRYELARAVPGLKVPFDAARRSYHVRAEGLSLTSDVERLRQAVARGGETGLMAALGLHRGPFLPSADSEWAVATREDVAWSLMRLGLSVLRDRHLRGDHDGCQQLAERLLEVDPLHVSLMEFLVASVRAIEGDVAAQGMAERLMRRFERDIGTRPAGWESPRADDGLAN